MGILSSHLQRANPTPSEGGQVTAPHKPSPEGKLGQTVSTAPGTLGRVTDSIVAEDSGTSPRWRWIAIALVVALVVAATAWLVTRPSEPTVGPPPSPTPASLTPSEPVDASASPSPATTSVPATTPVADAYATCDPLDSEGFVPDTFQMENPEADEQVLSLGLDAGGNIAAPPKDLPRTASWWNQGPRPGSDTGKVVMSIHTYRSGGALGNEMYSDAGPSLVPGDLIKLEGADGRTACYEFVEATKIWVEDYDVNSDVMVDFTGDPLLTIVICWDFNRGTEDWDSRVLFYAAPVNV